MKLGLKRNVVEMVPRQDVWADFFAEMQHELRTHIGDKNHPVEWFGSTSINSVDFAKPVLDIAIADENMKVAKFLKKALKITERRYMSKEESTFNIYNGEGCLTHSLHAIPLEGDWWARYFQFKRLLTEFSDIGKLYSFFKQRNARQFPNDVRKYNITTFPFVASATLVAFEKYGAMKSNPATINALKSSANSMFYSNIKSLTDDIDPVEKM